MIVACCALCAARSRKEPSIRIASANSCFRIRFCFDRDVQLARILVHGTGVCLLFVIIST